MLLGIWFNILYSQGLRKQWTFSKIKACNSSDSRKLNFQKNIAPSPPLTLYQQQVCTFGPNSDVSGQLQFSFGNWTETLQPLALCVEQKWSEILVKLNRILIDVTNLFFRDWSRSMNLRFFVGNYWSERVWVTGVSSDHPGVSQPPCFCCNLSPAVRAFGNIKYDSDSDLANTAYSSASFTAKRDIYTLTEGCRIVINFLLKHSANNWT